MKPGLSSRVIPSQLDAHPLPHSRSRPKPHPIFGHGKGKKRKIGDLSGDSNLHRQASGENKRNRSTSSLRKSNPIAAPVGDIRQALIAQCEPQPDAISSLCM